MRGILRVPDSWKLGMPGFALDAELIGGRGGQCHPRHDARRLAGLRFMVFDAPKVVALSRKRLAFIKTLSIPSQCDLVEQIRCRNTPHLIEFADQIVVAGFEWAVDRDGQAMYRNGRTHDVLRWVPQCPSLNRWKIA